MWIVIINTLVLWNVLCRNRWKLIEKGFFVPALFGLFLQLISSKHSLNTTFMGQKVAKEKQDDTLDNTKKDDNKKKPHRATHKTYREFNGSIPADMYSMTHLTGLRLLYLRH